MCIVSFSFLVFAFSEASDLLVMNLCNKGKQPILEAITHRPKVVLIYIVYSTNLISHFVLSLVCKSSSMKQKLMHNFEQAANKEHLHYCESIRNNMMHVCYRKNGNYSPFFHNICYLACRFWLCIFNHYVQNEFLTYSQ